MSYAADPRWVRRIRAYCQAHNVHLAATAAGWVETSDGRRAYRLDPAEVEELRDLFATGDDSPEGEE